MRKLRIGTALLVLAVVLCGVALADLPPKPADTVQTYVFDYTSNGVISDQDSRDMTAYATDLEKKTGVTAVAVLVDFLDGEEIGIYAHDLINAWGIGSASKNDGVLLLYARGDREISIATGAGSDHILNAATRGRILDDYALPKFAKNDHSGGIRDAFYAACDRIAQSQGFTLASTQSSSSASNYFNPIEEFFGGIFGNQNHSSNHEVDYSYEYTYDEDDYAPPRDEGVNWFGTLVVIFIVVSMLRRSARRGSGSGCLPFLLGGFIGNAMRRGSSTRTSPRVPPFYGGSSGSGRSSGSWGGSSRSGGSGGFGGGSGGGFRSGGGSSRGNSTSRKF